MQISNDSFLEETTNSNLNLKNELSRYISFYPYILISIILGLLLSFIYLRYAELTFQTKAQIQIIDKAQDSEMALPTSMTIFNRSMVNLENEIGIIKSFDLNKSVVEKLNYNRIYKTKGNIKTSVNHHSEWINDYVLNIKDKYDENAIRGSYQIEFQDKKMNIYHNDKVYNFNSFSTTEKENDLPFDLTVRNLISDDDRILIFQSIEKSASKFISNLDVEESGTMSDQLNLSLTYVNPVIATEYLNNLILEFDLDGISDRQKGYERTIDFVESRSVILERELEKIEDEKQKFKSSNNITDIVSDASVNITQLYNYDSEIFKLNSQKDLLKLLEETITVNNLELIPYNIGIDNNQINQIINQYNISVSSREKYLKSGAGLNNPIIKNLDKEAENIIDNLKISISNYRKNIEIELNNLSEKEEEFAEKYNQIPINEKRLRAINRELEIKEALFLLLLQKKEEAAINYAVVKPSIKVIDFARVNKNPISPNSVKTYSILFLISLFLPLVILFIYFSLDTKIHTREQLKSIFINIPILSEVPYLRDDIEK